MARLRKGRSKYDLILKSETERPIYLMFDRDRFKPGQFRIQSHYAPNEPGQQGDISIQEWFWQNGPGGAGTSVETPATYGNGASDYGEFVWLRRKGVAQAAGALTEVELPAATAALTTGSFTSGAEFGAAQDFFITTRNRYILKVAGGTGAITEQDCGSGSETVGIASFDVAGAPRLYVGDARSGIQVYDGTAWSEGEAGTEREWLVTVYQNLGDSLATGGLSDESGVGGFRIYGTKTDGTGFYIVSGDPKVAANWSALTYVRPTGDTILNVVASNRVVWFGKASGVYGCNEIGYTPNFTKWMEAWRSTNNCRVMTYWNDLIWAATEGGLMAFAPDGTRKDIGAFAQFGNGSNVGPIFGRPRAIAPGPEGIWVGYYNNTDSYIGMLKLDTDGTYRWSMAECVVRGEQVTFLHQASPGGVPRLWIGTVDGTGHFHLYWQSLPRSGDPEMDLTQANVGGNFVPASDWMVQLSEFNGGRTIPKTFRRWDGEFKYLGEDYPDNTVDVQVSADGGTFATQGTATRNKWSAAPSSDYIRATSAQIRLEVHNSTNSTVIVKSISSRFSPHPALTEVTNYPVIFGEGITPGNPDPRIVMRRLERMQREGPVTIIDKYGREKEGLVEPRFAKTIMEEADRKGWTVHGDLTISTTRNIAHFDAGDAFDGGESFG